MAESSPRRKRSFAECLSPACGASNSQKRADQRQGNEFRRFFIAHAGHGNERNPFTDAAFAEEGKGVGNGVNFRNERKRRGIQITQEVVAERNFGLDALADFAEVHLRVVDSLKNAQKIQFVAGNIVMADHLRLDEKVALKVGVSSVIGALQFLVGLDFFGDQKNAGAGINAGESLLLFGGGGDEIDFDEICESHEGLPFR